MSTRVVAVLSFASLLFPFTSLAAWQDDGNSVCSATAWQQSPAAIADGAGGAFIAWHDGRSGLNDIYAQRIDAQGNVLWTVDGVAVCTLGSEQSSPVLMADGSGGVIIVWHDWRNEATMNQDLYAQRLNGSGVVQWTANGVVLVTAAGGQHFPKLVPNGGGGVMAVWYDVRNGSFNEDIYGARLASNGAALDPPGGFVVSNAAQVQTPWSALPHNNGGAIVAWIDTRNGNANIYVARISPLGSVLDVVGIPICVAGGDQFYPSIISDGAGGAIIAWSDLANVGEIFAQRINSSGVIQWTFNGVPVGTTLVSSIGQTPQMLPDGAGGAILSWFRYDGSDRNIYAQRINANGGKQWPASSLPVCTDATDQSYLSMTSDNAGGVVVGWTDPRNNTFGGDVFAQRVLPNGSLAWFPNGVSVSDIPGDQLSLTMVSDQTGGAIFVWGDRRNFEMDIYANRLGPEGLTPTGVGDAPVVARLRQNFPNPFNPETSIPFSLAHAGRVTLRVYDVNGRFVATLLDENRDPGEHVARWDGRDASGLASSSGVYFVRLEVNGATETRKLVLVK